MKGISFEAGTRLLELGANNTWASQECQLFGGGRERAFALQFSSLDASVRVFHARNVCPNQPLKKSATNKFRFIDLFCGIGGFRLAFQRAGGGCVFSCDWDKFSRQTYEANFNEVPRQDIREVPMEEIPPFDILCAGFPCQPFSIAGVSKKNSLGRKHGFDDERQGNLFFHIVEILEKHRPKAFFLENVKNLVSHDKGNTFKTIKEALISLGYSFHSTVLNGKHFVPQHRARTFM